MSRGSPTGRGSTCGIPTRVFSARRKPFMGRQLVIRLFQSFVSLIGMSLLIFVLVRASGDPVDLMRTATTTEAEIANIKVQWGLDKSYPEQYWVFVSGMARGDLGKSLIQRR